MSREDKLGNIFQRVGRIILNRGCDLRRGTCWPLLGFYICNWELGLFLDSRRELIVWEMGGWKMGRRIGGKLRSGSRRMPRGGRG